MCGSEQDGQLGKTGTWAGTQMHMAEEIDVQSRGLGMQVCGAERNSEQSGERTLLE